ncbi:predicted protein [Pyrenophora tritici-repentis Pt-1C-BFP]|uniref:Uncharacterized protein n=1 Tax=Pyrenophora tritici-repentis (strain Pt-1C-BFP) TaxID=426418 RepID=B2VYR9_PYRTR|nr:uncharacterized protein PTRG_02559 [Pyrenophora tritici-repentis Pt-1C-BFP]EDU45082.1 predicted protein [Pyrenophora tritici-repentis Pt-1C-BFP]
MGASQAAARGKVIPFRSDSRWRSSAITALSLLHSGLCMATRCRGDAARRTSKPRKVLRKTNIKVLSIFSTAEETDEA